MLILESSYAPPEYHFPILRSNSRSTITISCLDMDSNLKTFLSPPAKISKAQMVAAVKAKILESRGFLSREQISNFESVLDDPTTVRTTTVETCAKNIERAIKQAREFRGKPNFQARVWAIGQMLKDHPTLSPESKTKLQIRLYNLPTYTKHEQGERNSAYHDREKALELLRELEEDVRKYISDPSQLERCAY